MGLFFMDGFDNLTTTTLTQGKWDQQSNFTVAAEGRFGGLKAYSSANMNSSSYLMKIMTTPKTHGIIGFAFKVNSFGNTLDTWAQLVSLRSSSTYQLQLYINDARGLTISLGGSGSSNNAAKGISLGSSNNGIIAAGVWYYLEFDFKISDVTVENFGYVRAFLNSQEVINSTNIDTNNTSGGTWDRIVFGGGGGSPSTTAFFTGLSVDDVYMIDNQVLGNAALGDSRITVLRPDNNGYTSNFLPSDLRPNYELVQEQFHDSDDSFVFSNVQGAKDMYEVEPLYITPQTIHGVQVTTTMKKDQTGTRQGRPLISHYDGASWNEYPGNSEILTTSYRMYSVATNIVPGTVDTAWTLTDLTTDIFQVGVEISE